ANVADNDEPAVIVTESDGHSSVVQGGSDTFTVALSRPPVTGGSVVVHADPPKGLVFLDDSGVAGPNHADGSPGGVSLVFDAPNGPDGWLTPHVVRFAVDPHVHDIPDVGDILLSVASDGFTGSAASAANLSDGSGTATLTRTAGSVAFPVPGTLGLPE